MRNITILLGGVALAIGIFCSSLYFRDAQRQLDLNGALSVSENADAQLEAQAFELKDLKGKLVALGSFRGKPVLLNFWATWCPPCVEELPALLKFAVLSKKKFGLEVVAVSTDKNAEIVLRFFKEKNLWPQEELPLTILIDSDASVAGNYGSTKYPETFFLNRDLKIVRKFVGPQQWDSQEIMQWVSEHVAK